jgi:nitronate monooxygenase
MAIPTSLLPGLRLPVVAAPMFLVSGIELLLAASRAGVVGTLPAMNMRSSEELSATLGRIKCSLGSNRAAYGINLIVGRSNPRLEQDLKVVVRHRVPLVITSFGADHTVIEAVHSYGGVVFHDVATPRHIEISAASGVDGLILLTHGAGGHGGGLHPFAMIQEARRAFKGTLVLSGSISTGADIFGAQAAGADLAYMGTRFIATNEANAPARYKEQIVQGRATDVVATSALTGSMASFLTQSLLDNGLDPAALSTSAERVAHPHARVGKPWKEIWSAGQGIGAISDIRPCRDLVDQLLHDYRAARNSAVHAAQRFIEPVPAQNARLRSALPTEEASR